MSKSQEGVPLLSDSSSESGKERLLPPVAEKKRTRKPIPIMVENPDGSMAEGVPPGYKEKTPPRSPRLPFTDDGLWRDLDAAGLQEEISLLHSRHEKLFITLLLLQFFCEGVFNVLYVVHVKAAVEEVRSVYRNVSVEHLQTILWSIFVLEVIYCVAYYSLAVAAVWTNRPRYYRMFATTCLVGILGQVLMAYVNKFNLLIFFLRLLAYIYSKFLRQLAAHMELMPALLGAQNGNGNQNQNQNQQQIIEQRRQELLEDDSFI